MFKKQLILILLLMTFFIGGCQEENVPKYEHEQKRQTTLLMNEAMRQVGMPNIHNFWQRKLLKMIYEIADQSDIITYAYTFNKFTGKFRYIGRSIGFGVPFSAQYTNPMQIVDDPYGSLDSGGRVIPQPDPNGIYMPTSSSATWIILIDEKTGKLNLVYMEPLLTVSQIPLPNNVVEGYPKDFWNKYYKGMYNLTKEQIRKGIEDLKRRTLN